MYDQRCAEWLLDAKPTHVALVGEPAFRLQQVLESANGIDGSVQVQQCHNLAEFDAQQVASPIKPENTALMLHLLGSEPHIDEMLGQARRVAPQGLLVEVGADNLDHQCDNGATPLSDERFFAFGFRLVNPQHNVETNKRLFAYRLREYKQAPEWLNARFWANPERFNIYED